ncbi:MAG: EAL domain-containing protein, partial [Gammaproteobacteria bacterium]|nr:EAL domain-containing protein [Gammaproteobacteria bacterium]
VSGAIGEETAVQAMKTGVHDYILKGSLARLVPVVERELREAEVRQLKRLAETDLRLAAKVFENSVEGITITDARGGILKINQAFTEITGYSEAEVLGLRPNILQSGRHDTAFYNDMWDSIINQGYWQGEIWNRRKNGEIYPEWLTISEVRDEHNEVTQYIGAFTDLSRIKRAEERVQHLSLYDGLTGLPNRSMFRQCFSQHQGRSEENNTRIALLYLDLDRFMRLNDSLGMAMGDQALKVVGHRLSTTLSDVHTVARLSGDEFAVVIPELKSIDDVSARVQQIVNIFSEPFIIGSHEIFLNATVGTAVYPDNSSDYDELLKQADIAMHQARANGVQYQLYQPHMNVGSLEVLDTENALRRALERDEFELYYQPQIDFSHGGIFGAEVLLRWRRPGVGLVSPAEFIPLLEETGLIVPVGEWVLQRACKDMQRWEAEMKTVDLRISVNLSPRQFRHKNLVEMVQVVLKETGLESSRLELEITESSVMDNPEAALLILQQLNSMGVRLAIDDFGTGYSSLSYLKRFPLDVLKIDQSFVADIPANEDDMAIVEAIIAMAHRLKLKVVAEGIENDAQLEFLRSNGCDHGQGYLFARPGPIENMLK